jgi:hypothetical protein
MTSVKANWSTPGFKYKVQEGTLKGKIYTVLPMRIVNAFVKTIIANVVVFVAIGLLFIGSPLKDNDAANVIGGIIWLGVIFLLFPYYLFVDGKHITITNSHCKIGHQHYRLTDMGEFRAKEITGKKNQHIIYFQYGRSTIKIGVRNNFEHQVDIISVLNNQRERLANMPVSAANGPVSTLDLRSANF